MSESFDNYNKLESCRMSASRHLISVLDLGHQALTGVFPKSRETPVTRGPLEVVWCPESGLLQLAHSFDANEIYGESYGYRSGLNQSMIQHLTRKIRNLERMANLGIAPAAVELGKEALPTLSR